MRNWLILLHIAPRGLRDRAAGKKRGHPPYNPDKKRFILTNTTYHKNLKYAGCKELVVF